MLTHAIFFLSALVPAKLATYKRAFSAKGKAVAGLAAGRGRKRAWLWPTKDGTAWVRRKPRRRLVADGLEQLCRKSSALPRRNCRARTISAINLANFLQLSREKILRVLLTSHARWICWSLGIHLFTASAIAGADTAGSYKGLSHFHRFLSEAPNLKHIHYALSGDSYSVGGQPLPGRVHFDGAWQNTTFFVRQWDKAPDQAEQVPGAGSVAGRSTDGIWWYAYGWNFPNPVIEVAEANANTGDGQGGQPLQQGRSLELVLNLIRSLGISFAIPGTIQWIDESSFNAQSAKGRIAGKITGWTNGAVARIEYSADHTPQIQRAVTYEYAGVEQAGGDRLPRAFTGWINGPAGWVRQGTIYLESIEIGNDENLPELGYLPGQVLQKLAAAPVLIIHSNGVPWELRGARLEPVGEPDRAVLSRLQSPSRKLYSWLAVIVIVNGVIIFWLRTRRSQSEAASGNSPTIS